MADWSNRGMRPFGRGRGRGGRGRGDGGGGGGGGGYNFTRYFNNSNNNNSNNRGGGGGGESVGASYGYRGHRYSPIWGDYYTQPEYMYCYYGSPAAARGVTGRGRPVVGPPVGQGQIQGQQGMYFGGGPTMANMPMAPPPPMIPQAPVVAGNVGGGYGYNGGTNVGAGTGTRERQLVPVPKIPFEGLVPPLEDTKTVEILAKNINGIWNSSKNSDDLKKALVEGYQNHDKDPFVLALFLMVRCKDFAKPVQGQGPSLSLIVIQELERYAERLNLRIKNPNIQLAALRLAVKQRDQELENLLLRVYRIQDIETEVIQCINGLVMNREFEQACLLAGAARIYCFQAYEFAIPLFFQDKLSVVEKYMEFSKPMQDQMTSFVDGFLFHGGSVDFNIDQYIREHNLMVTPQQRSRWTEKSLKKLVKKWIGKFGNAHAAPNVQRSVNCGQIKFLTSQRYELNALEANFLELIASCIRSDTTSHSAEYALRSILNYGDKEAVIKLVREHQIDVTNSPDYIRSIVEQGLQAQSNQDCQPSVKSWEEEDWETGEIRVRQVSTEVSYEPVLEPVEAAAVNVYTLPIPVSNVVIVSKGSDVAEFCDYIKNRLQSENILESGFDCEWRSINPFCAALLQISFSETVFLIDLFTLRSKVGSDIQFDRLSEAYFSNPKVLKLGYDFTTDLTMLSRVHPKWAKIRLLMKNTIDLRIVKDKIIKKIPDFFKGLGASGEMKEGLSDLVLQCFGKIMSKEEQISDWERRPLRESQIVYAAADCYCLLDLYLFFKNAESVKAYGFQELLQD